MELETDLPPPPYSEVDPSQAATPETSTMGGGDYSPSSTLRPTSSQSLRAPSFITLRGGYLRGVPFSEDPVTNNHFQERAFQFDPTRELMVLHREITADTSRTDLPLPEMDPDRDVSEQDWQTFVNYVLTELGNETSSSRHRKKLSAEEFYRRQTKLDQLISEWNEAFFQPRSIKFMPHFYYTSPRSAAPAYRSQRIEQAPGVRRIPIEDGPMNIPDIRHQHRSRGSLQSSSAQRGHTFSRGGPFFRGGPSNVHFMGDSIHGNMRGSRHRHDSGHSWDNYRGRRRSADLGRHDRGRRCDSESSSSSSSSDSESEAETRSRRGSRRTSHRVRRQHGNQGHEHRRHRSHSTSSESSLSSVSSIDSDEMSEPAIGAIRDAIANFRLDPTNAKHNRIAYKELIQNVRNKKKESLQGSPSSRRDIKRASKAQRKAIRDDLKSLRTEAKHVCKEAKNERKAARKEAQKAQKEVNKAQKQAKKAIRDAEKAARKALKDMRKSSSSHATRGQTAGIIQDPSYNMPGRFPETPESQSELQAQELDFEIDILEKHIKSLQDKADRDARGITQPEKQKLARAAYDEEIRAVQQKVESLKNQLSGLRGIQNESQQADRRQSDPQDYTHANYVPNGYGTRIGQQGAIFGRQMGSWGEQFGRDMGSWGENFGKEMERWGQDFGRQMNNRGRQIGQRFG